jgi:hypothetical protein
VNEGPGVFRITFARECEIGRFYLNNFYLNKLFKKKSKYQFIAMLAAFLCGETRIVPQIHEFSIFFTIFMKFGHEKS